MHFFRALIQPAVVTAIGWLGWVMPSAAAPAAPATVAGPSVALYYGQAPVPREMRVFDWVVLEADHHPQPRKALPAPSLPLAYVAVGESHPSRTWSADVSAQWVLGQNPAWGSRVMDMAQPAWRAFLIERVFRPQWEQGYRGFFLDTLDSYRLVPGHSEVDQQQGLIALVREVRRRWPEARLILNRGFEVLPELRGQVDMVAAESLFQSWDAGQRRYRPVPAADRQWLLSRLQAARDLGMPCLSIDYVPPHDRPLARETAQQIVASGCLPYVTDPALHTVGVGLVEPVARRVLMLYNGAESLHVRFSNAKRFLQMPIEYAGYVVDYADVLQPLPQNIHTDRYAGIVSWFTGDMPAAAAARLNEWWAQRIAQGLPFAMFGHLPTPLSGALAQQMGLTTPQVDNAPPGLAVLSPLLGMEMAPPLQTAESVLRLADGSTPLVGLRTARGGHLAAAALTPRGGFVLDPFVLQELPGVDQSRWIVDPFAFLQAALRLPPLPVPDTTTENGRRLLTVHIDGDGFMSRAELPGTPLAGRALLDEVLRQQRVPTTLSIIESEVAPHGLYPATAAEAEAAAREAFRLPHVEAATHTWSHPFIWSAAQRAAGRINQATGSFYFDIPGYRFNLEREIAGSARYIENRLCPAGKTVVLLQWSGDCSPDADALAVADGAGLLNINGGDTTIARNNPSVSAIAAQGLKLDGRLQVHAPITNENLYTNLWTGPFDGFRRVIETLEMTDRPRRIKPMGIYYHTYSASKPASLKALREVYAWALSQPVHPVFTSDFVRKVHDFYDGALARRDGRWLWRASGALRTLRLPPALGLPDLARSHNLAGWAPGSDGTYAHLGPGDTWLATGSAATDTARLLDANGRITALEPRPRGLRVGLQAHVPLQWTVPEGCESQHNGVRIPPSAQRNGALHYKAPHERTTIDIVCAR